MSDDKLRQKARAEEDQFFRKHDAELLAKLRQRAKLADLTHALAEKLRIDDPGLLARITALGVTLDTGPAFLLAPLVQIAWAEGFVTHKEKREVLSIAEQRGIAQGSVCYALLEEWLDKRPSDAFFAAAVEAIKTGLAVLPEAERRKRVEQIVTLCQRVAATSGGLARALGLSGGIEVAEQAVLDAIAERLGS